jgi:hypothetical protein
VEGSAQAQPPASDSKHATGDAAALPLAVHALISNKAKGSPAAKAHKLGVVPPKGPAKRASPKAKACVGGIISAGGLRSRRAPVAALAAKFGAAKPASLGPDAGAPATPLPAAMCMHCSSVFSCAQPVTLEYEKILMT